MIMGHHVLRFYLLFVKQIKNVTAFSCGCSGSFTDKVCQASGVMAARPAGPSQPVWCGVSSGPGGAGAGDPEHSSQCAWASAVQTDFSSFLCVESSSILGVNSHPRTFPFLCVL